MINILSKEDLDCVEYLPKEVVEVLSDTIDVLDEAYGSTRSLTDDGGYVCVIENIEEVNNKLDKKNSETLKQLIEKKKKLSTRESMLRNDRILKRRECVHLEREKDNKYKELLKVMEEEIKLSNSEIEGQLEIPGMRRIKSR